MLEQLKKILDFIQQNRKEVNSFCCRLVCSCIVVVLFGGLFLAGTVIQSSVLSRAIVSIALFIGVVSGVIGIFTGDFS